MKMTQSLFGIRIVQYFDGVRQGKFVNQAFSYDKWPEDDQKSVFPGQKQEASFSCGDDQEISGLNIHCSSLDC